jgi:uncharacterized membrane protein YagU involved in acid resistance
MENSSARLKDKASLGELAVEGLFAGIAAGAVMLAYLLVFGMLSGEAVTVMMGRFSIQVPPNPLQGALLHLAVSAIYGLLFGIVWRFLGRRFSAWGTALLYGLVIYLLARFVLLPESGSPLLDIPPLHFALAHLVYGLVLGLWFKGK